VAEEAAAAALDATDKDVSIGSRVIYERYGRARDESD